MVNLPQASGRFTQGTCWKLVTITQPTFTVNNTNINVTLQVHPLEAIV